MFEKHFTEGWSKNNLTWNCERPEGQYVGGTFPVSNSSQGYHNLLRQWWEHYFTKGKVLLISESEQVKREFKFFYPDWDIKTTDLQNTSADILGDISSKESPLHEKFDLIINQATLEHTYNPFQVMENLTNALNPGGILVTHTHPPMMGYHQFPRDYFRFMKDWWFDLPSLIKGIELVEFYMYKNMEVFSLYRKTPTVGFVIAACSRTRVHLTGLYTCIYSIQQFHPNTKVVVIVDFSTPEQFVKEMKHQFRNSKNVEFITDTPKVPADMLVHYYFKKCHWFDKMVFLHDSTYILEPLDITKTSSLDYIWHFTNHRLQWHTIEEPQNEFNIRHGIKVHDDLMNYCIENLITKEGFKQYCKEIYPQKNKWAGCFGCMCVIDYDIVCKLDEECGLIEIMSQINTYRLRVAMESIFSLACQYVLKKEIQSSYDGLYYDGNYHCNFIRNFMAKIGYHRLEVSQ